MSIAIEDRLENPSYSTPQFRTAPWFITRKKNIKSKGSALVLSVLWAAIPDLNERRLVSLSSEEIAKRAGLKCKSEALRRHLVRLEKLGYIKRQGNHKNRTIEVLIFPPDDDTQGLIIPEDILLSDLSPTKKLLLTITQYFQKMSVETICERLGITKIRYYQVINKIEPPKETKSNPLKKLSQPPKETNTIIGIDGYRFGIDVLSKDNTLGPSALCCLEEPPTKEVNSPTKKEYNMSERAPYNTPAPAGWLQEKLRLLKLESSKQIQRNDFKKKKEVLIKHYPIEVTTDMNWIKENLPFVHSPRPGTKVYNDDARVIKALQLGPNNYLRPDEIQTILNNMIGITIHGSNHPLTEIVLRDRFLNRTFNQAERRELYQHFNNMLSVEYGGQGIKKPLAWGMRTYSGWSFLASLCIIPPVRVVVQPIISEEAMKKIQYELDETTSRAFVQGITLREKQKLARNLSLLKPQFFQKLKLTFGRQANYHYGDWRPFFNGLLEFIEDDNWKLSHVKAGWFHPGSEIIKDWMDEVYKLDFIDGKQYQSRMAQPQL
jgi:hypothetical protein